ncbi:MAG: hypothetical protein GX028_05975, partial [Clostridiaceae bacterium]|nr:hypothetical protein [Clostridiaceae bacterium]
ADRIIKVLESYKLPVSTDLPLEDILPVIASDKKNMGSRLYFVLLRGIGDAFLKPMKRTELAELLQEVWQHA